MVALRRLFHGEKAPSTPLSGDRDGSAYSTPERSSGSVLSQPLSDNEHFHSLERDFETLHEQLKAQPTSPPTHIPLARASSRLARANARHIDLADALFTSHRYQIQSANTLSPITPYNEDVAERNMVPFLRPRGSRTRNAYNRIMSVLYQEDVADRNIAQNRRRSRSLSRSSTRSRLATSHTHQPNSRQADGARGRPRSKTKDSQLVNSISQEALYSVPKSVRDKVASDSRDPSPNGGLRTQRSAPTVLSDRPISRGTSSRTQTHLGVPPAHKQGDTWSNAPLPDSPTLPMGSYVTTRSDEKPKPQAPGATSPSARLASVPIGQGRPRAGSKKNVLDLSIDTELAARGRSKKIVHRAIQPPTPNSHDMKATPNIAEVLNSPVPVATPSPSPLWSSNQKVAEIMDMFRKAYDSTREITPHPTFETLQDAIIREINSHEAFQRVPVPGAGPPFTPSPSQDSFDRSPSQPKPIVTKDGKDGQLSKLMRKSSLKRHRRGSESRGSISTSISFIGRRTLEAPTAGPNRRRHTDAPPPTPGFFDTIEFPRPPTSDVPVTYMDLLNRSEKSADTKRSRATSINGGGGRSTASTPSVVCMRAQTSRTTNDSRRSSVDDGDSEIIHLPSVRNIPRVQIHGVDGNNVTYGAENPTPRNTYRLVNWSKMTQP
ncbi:hypothetical protein BJX61DRAFT_372266 [Aspergillus egyptiacus]|nr:hypothetical protein BJX61DRAFT_372266 [Aspergillus egyptiacus]